MIGYSQNFLISQGLVGRIVKLAKLPNGSNVLEIGPGKGIITEALAQAVGENGRVVAVELDGALVGQLERQFRPSTPVEIVQGDILQFDLAQLPQGFSVFANVPFNITSPLLDKLFLGEYRPKQAHLILQKDSLLTQNKIGIWQNTFKSLLLQPLYEIDEVHRFSNRDFKPSPSVDTSLFQFVARKKPLVDISAIAHYKDFLSFVSKDRVGEGVWRKLFNKRDLKRLVDGGGLVLNRGLKTQSIDAITAAFGLFQALPPDRKAIVANAMTNLREQQTRTNRLNAQGGHHRTKAKKKRRKPRR